jgi:uncharacterized membrane protein YjgN (DUF898 family)
MNYWKVAARSKVWNVFEHSSVGIMSSNPTRGMDVSVFSIFVLSYAGTGLASVWTPVQKVQYRLYKIRNFRINSECQQARELNPSMRKKNYWRVKSSVADQGVCAV